MGTDIDEQRGAMASLENQHNNATIFSDERGGEFAIGDENYTFFVDSMLDNGFEISDYNRGGDLVVGLAIENGENMGTNIGEQPVAIVSWENQHNNATISSIGAINSNISLQPLLEANVVHTEENV